MSAVLAALRGARPHANDRAAVSAAFRRLRRQRSPLGPYAITATGDSTLGTFAVLAVRDGRTVLLRTQRAARR